MGRKKNSGRKSERNIINIYDISQNTRKSVERPNSIKKKLMVTDRGKMYIHEFYKIYIL